MVAVQPEDLQLLLHTAMPYGKHKGVMIAALPASYLAWMARQGFPQGRLGQLLHLMHEIDHNDLRHLLHPLRA